MFKLVKSPDMNFVLKNTGVVNQMVQFQLDWRQQIFKLLKMLSHEFCTKKHGF